MCSFDFLASIDFRWYLDQLDFFSANFIVKVIQLISFQSAEYWEHTKQMICPLDNYFNVFDLMHTWSHIDDNVQRKLIL